MELVTQAPSIPWMSLSPMLIVIGAAVLGVLVEAFVPHKARRGIQILLSILAVVVAFVAVIARWTAVVSEPLAHSEFIEDTLTLTTQAILLVIAFLALLVIADRSELGDGMFAAQPSDRPGSSKEDLSIAKGYQRSEIFPLVLFSLGGMMVFPGANTLIALFVALELISLPLYILVATARRRRQLSQEASLKYFLLGAFASAFLLMGSALLYGVSGSVVLSEISVTIPFVAGMDWMLIVGVFMLMVGLLFKVGAAPFHAWTPDVYQGAPTPITGFMAAAVKIAAFAAMVRIYLTIGVRLEWDLIWILAVVAGLTIAIGTFVGLVQTDVKRLLAYSSIAHAGFVLIGVLAATETTASSVLFYLLGYGIATVGAFGVIALVRNADENANITGEATEISKWAGLGRKSPVAAGAMLIFLLSFAGIPLTSGFIGKFLVFADGIEAGYPGLVIVALVASAITAFYYFRLVVLMFFTEPSENTVVVKSEGYTSIAVVIAALSTIFLGVFPQPILDALANVVVFLP
ncbi:MAG: NADH-quinone oxidoreductase subunit NuoN [Actinomycetaceae bacterium]|nr:NADH-quinone oxidoreductase subunit NuoN [Actinomycetaceae bacterium]